MSTPCVQSNTCSYKGGTKGARIEHKSTGVPINFLSQLLKCKSLRQDMNFTRLLLSRAVWLPLLKEWHSFISLTNFPRRKLSTRQRWPLGLCDTRQQVRGLQAPEPPPTALEALGRGLLCPCAPVYVPIGDQGKQTAFNNWRVNESDSSSHRTACTWRWFQSLKEHVRTEKAETREPLGMFTWRLRLTTSPDM